MTAKPYPSYGLGWPVLAAVFGSSTTRNASGGPVPGAGTTVVEPAVEDEIGGRISRGGHGGEVSDGRRRCLQPPGNGHVVVRLDDVVDHLERVRAVPAVHVLLEDVDRAVPALHVRGRHDRGVALGPRGSQAEHVARSWHARAVVGDLLQIAAVSGRVIPDDLRTVGSIGTHAVLEIEPSHRQFDAFPLELTPGTGEELDRRVVTAAVGARSACGEAVPAGKRKRTRVVVVVTGPTPPGWETHRWRVDAAVDRDDDMLDDWRDVLGRTQRVARPPLGSRAEVSTALMATPDRCSLPRPIEAPPGDASATRSKIPVASHSTFQVLLAWRTKVSDRVGPTPGFGCRTVLRVNRGGSPNEIGERTSRCS